MRTRSFLLVAIGLVAAVVSGGCDGVFRRPVATIPQVVTDTPDGPGLRAFVLKSIERANRRAAAISGKTFVEFGSDERTVVFAPAGSVKADNESSPTPPKGSVKKRWTKKYAIAQQYSYKYHLDQIGPILTWSPPLNAEAALVNIRIVARHRHGVASEAGPQPQPPVGMAVWEPKFQNYDGGKFAASADIDIPHVAIKWSKDLPALPKLGVLANSTKDPLAEKAGIKMMIDNERVGERAFQLRAVFCPQRKIWLFAPSNTPAN